jgi:myo-inositol-hexaphosphate 3-phosphohydrolase
MRFNSYIVYYKDGKDDYIDRYDIDDVDLDTVDSIMGIEDDGLEVEVYNSEDGWIYDDDDYLDLDWD